MHRIDGAGATIDGLFTEGDPTTAIPATTVTAAWLNAVQEEIAAVVEGAGLALNKPDNGQLSAAIAALIAAAIAGFALADGSVTTPKLAAGAVTTAKIGDGEVTDAKLAAALDLSGKTLTLSAAQRAVDYIEIRDEKASGTDGGTFTSGAWQTRTLNTEHADTGGHASIASNQVTLAAGTYECDIRCPARAVSFHQARLRNITDGTTTLVGSSQESGTGSGQTGFSIITGRFTIAAPKVFEVQHRCSASGAGTGFGSGAGFGETEVYTVARFWKVG